MLFKGLLHTFRFGIMSFGFSQFIVDLKFFFFCIIVLQLFASDLPFEFEVRDSI